MNQHDCPDCNCSTKEIPPMTFPVLTQEQKEWVANQKKLNELYMTRLYPLLNMNGEVPVTIRTEGKSYKLILSVTAESHIAPVASKIPEDLREQVEIVCGGPHWY